MEIRKTILVSIFFITIILISCEDKKEYGTFEIYFLLDSNQSYLDINEMSLSNIKIEQNPIITTDDIIEYRIFYIPDNPIRTHALFINETKIQELGNKKRPFLVMVNKKNIYIGEYWPQPSGGVASFGITMVHMINNRYDIMPNNETDNELINHDRLISALENSGIEIIYENISD